MIYRYTITLERPDEDPIVEEGFLGPDLLSSLPQQLNQFLSIIDPPPPGYGVRPPSWSRLAIDLVPEP